MNQIDTPVVVYDNQCYLCIKFAEMVNTVANGKITFIGHYTKTGEKIRKEMLDSSALEMFWFIDKKTAYGGRAALWPLFLAIMTRKGNNSKEFNEKNNCFMECKNAKAVFLRSASLITNYKKISIKSDKISV